MKIYFQSDSCCPELGVVEKQGGGGRAETIIGTLMFQVSFSWFALLGRNTGFILILMALKSINFHISLLSDL